MNAVKGIAGVMALTKWEGMGENCSTSNTSRYCDDGLPQNPNTIWKDYIISHNGVVGVPVDDMTCGTIVPRGFRSTMPGIYIHMVMADSIKMT